ncbi:hypothetical protein PR048_023915 [Dryococelus australis]|uniref:Uncharacterized protein n=1 Tax=Dryococelus australis TaxID=614101 RepID=A0ABQ9GVH7_9NEOP|nr:hypothetical protein PR048_023915 [Dryococelus australis]
MMQVVFTADICKMYRQIEIHIDNRKYQYILWFPTPEDDTVQQLALDETHQFPQASQVLLRDVFVDDIVTGSSSVEKAIQLKDELWSSNNPSWENIPAKQCEVLRSCDQETSPSIEVLGGHWYPATDEIVYHINILQISY